jgi:oxygen-independent coproporphyrinogen-3 oxidase
LNDSLGVYISIPFCKAKCSFCNFASDVFGMERMQGYVDRVCGELRAARGAAVARSVRLPEVVDTVYFGGGTPSLLEPEHLEQILGVLRGEFEVTRDAEMTLEAAPGQVAERTLEAAMGLGVNRVSFGVQSFVDAEAAAVGRLHTGRECHEEIRRMRAGGVGRVSLDLIAGLPHQTEASWRWSVGQAIETGVDHVSVYLLEVDEDSRLGREAIAGGRRYAAGALPSEDATADWYGMACGVLEKAGLRQYEISNFAMDGFASRHNLKYWQRKPYLGVGLDAHSMLFSEGAGTVAVRWANPDGMGDYLGGGDGSWLRVLSSGGVVVDRVGVDEAFEESLFLGLRLNVGVDLDELARQFGRALVQGALESLGDAEAAGLVERDGSVIRLTGAGRLASNEVFNRLLVV